jgi:hypothetical protein
MSRRKPPDQFTLHVPDEKEPERDMPAELSLVDSGIHSKPKRKNKLGGGAYNPYASDGTAGDTTRIRRPRVDLRVLSEQIKAQQAAGSPASKPAKLPARKKR